MSNPFRGRPSQSAPANSDNPAQHPYFPTNYHLPSSQASNHHAPPPASQQQFQSRHTPQWLQSAAQPTNNHTPFQHSAIAPNVHVPVAPYAGRSTAPLDQNRYAVASHAQLQSLMPSLGHPATVPPPQRLGFMGAQPGQQTSLSHQDLDHVSGLVNQQRLTAADRHATSRPKRKAKARGKGIATPAVADIPFVGSSAMTVAPQYQLYVEFHPYVVLPGEVYNSPILYVHRAAAFRERLNIFFALHYFDLPHDFSLHELLQEIMRRMEQSRLRYQFEGRDMLPSGVGWDSLPFYFLNPSNGGRPWKDGAVHLERVQPFMDLTLAGLLNHHKYRNLGQLNKDGEIHIIRIAPKFNFTAINPQLFQGNTRRTHRHRCIPARIYHHFKTDNIMELTKDYRVEWEADFEYDDEDLSSGDDRSPGASEREREEDGSDVEDVDVDNSDTRSDNTAGIDEVASDVDMNIGQDFVPQSHASSSAQGGRPERDVITFTSLSDRERESETGSPEFPSSIRVQRSGENRQVGQRHWSDFPRPERPSSALPSSAPPERRPFSFPTRPPQIPQVDSSTPASSAGPAPQNVLSADPTDPATVIETDALFDGPPFVTPPTPIPAMTTVAEFMEAVSMASVNPNYPTSPPEAVPASGNRGLDIRGKDVDEAASNLHSAIEAAVLAGDCTRLLAPRQFFVITRQDNSSLSLGSGPKREVLTRLLERCQAAFDKYFTLVRGDYRTIVAGLSSIDPGLVTSQRLLELKVLGATFGLSWAWLGKAPVNFSPIHLLYVLNGCQPKAISRPFLEVHDPETLGNLQEFRAYGPRGDLTKEPWRSFLLHHLGIPATSFGQPPADEAAAWKQHHRLERKMLLFLTLGQGVGSLEFGAFNEGLQMRCANGFDLFSAMRAFESGPEGFIKATWQGQIKGYDTIRPHLRFSLRLVEASGAHEILESLHQINAPGDANYDAIEALSSTAARKQALEALEAVICRALQTSGLRFPKLIRASVSHGTCGNVSAEELSDPAFVVCRFYRAATGSTTLLPAGENEIKITFVDDLTRVSCQQGYFHWKTCFREVEVPIPTLLDILGSSGHKPGGEIASGVDAVNWWLVEQSLVAVGHYGHL